MLTAGAHVRAYDPMAMPSAHRLLAARLGPADLDRLTLAPHANDALAGADVLALATKWTELTSPDFEARVWQPRAGAVQPVASVLFMAPTEELLSQDLRWTLPSWQRGLTG